MESDLSLLAQGQHRPLGLARRRVGAVVMAVARISRRRHPRRPAGSAPLALRLSADLQGRG